MYLKDLITKPKRFEINKVLFFKCNENKLKCAEMLLRLLRGRYEVNKNKINSSWLKEGWEYGVRG